MNKKLMALAVAGAFAAPAAALAQASNVQIFGTVYVEYAYAKQGHGRELQPAYRTASSSTSTSCKPRAVKSVSKVKKRWAAA